MNPLEKIFKTVPEVELAYQYGSTIKNPGRRPKDVDIGILLKGKISAEKQFEIYDALSEKLSKFFKKEADIAVLNKASPMLAYQILKTGKLVYGNIRRAKQFVVETLTRYFDYLPIHQFFVQHLENRLGKHHD